MIHWSCTLFGFLVAGNIQLAKQRRCLTVNSFNGIFQNIHGSEEGDHILSTPGQFWREKRIVTNYTARHVNRCKPGLCWANWASLAIDCLHQNDQCWLNAYSWALPPLHSDPLGWGLQNLYFNKCHGRILQEVWVGNVAIWNTQKISNLKFATKGLLVPWCLLRNWGSTDTRTQGLHKDTWQKCTSGLAEKLRDVVFVLFTSASFS